MVIASHILSGFQGCILGGAIGDALGYPVEFLSLDEIGDQFGEEGITSFYSFGSHPDGLISDDTQWTLAYAKALLDTRAGLQKNLVGALRRRAVQWYESPENNRAPGNACLDGCENLLEGVSWFEAGSLRAKGSGAVMRVAPFGLVYANQPALLDEITAVSSLGTHRNPTAVAAAVVTARIIAFALQSQDADYFKQSVIDRVLLNLHPHSAALASKLKKVKDLAAIHPKEAFSILGEGWVAEEAIAGALYCVLSTSGFSEAVLRAVNTDGDSDTFGAITGNIAGALYGMDNIPSDWVRIVEKNGELFKVGHKLYNLAMNVDRMKASP
ncbi:MAG: ADP-ribosylglycohydrolase family protein, partial [bacterium]|nr:ADP-ribosylglycohydrolase family protein [bacterium]